MDSTIYSIYLYNRTFFATCSHKKLHHKDPFNNIWYRNIEHQDTYDQIQRGGFFIGYLCKLKNFEKEYPEYII